MIHLLNIASNGCIFFTIVMFATGIPQCLQMIKTKSTKNITFLPYLMTNINNVSWIVYGQMTENFTIIFVNAVKSILQTIYMSIFIYFSTTKNKEIQQTSLSAITAVVVWFISTQMVNDAEFSTYIVGIISCGITMLMFSSPLAEINTVFKGIQAG
ncbi:sugar transporter SWEET1-like [Clavelina lepadiformis]